jgi:membrane protein implicated in regulation of membrane protease activity
VTGDITPLLAAAAFAALSFALAGLAVVTLRAVRSQRGLPAHSRLLDSTATVLVDLAPEGRVLVQGENWAAVLDEAFRDQVIPAGRRVRVVGVSDLRVIVTPPVEELLAQARESPPLPYP